MPTDSKETTIAVTASEYPLGEVVLPKQTPVPARGPARVLAICLGQEPESLFPYADSSIAARSVREAIYDGPIDYVNFQPSAVILENIPTLANGGISIEPIGVNPGTIVVGIDGILSPLREGMLYKPSGCRDISCAQTYSGQEPVLMDHAVVRYKLRPDILWSDGEPLTADDSQYSYEIAASLFPKVKAEIIANTLNYFVPMPEHAWGALPEDELLLSDMVNRTPIGWGGANVSGYSNPEYDRICSTAHSSMSGMTGYADSHVAAQANFSEDLPSLPLYMRPDWAAMRSDMCGVQVDPSAHSSLRNIEGFDYGEGCSDVR